MAMREEVTKFIEAYGAASSYGPSAAIEFYAEPCLTVAMGVARMHPTRKAMEIVLGDVDARERTRGFTRWTQSATPLSSDFSRPGRRGHICWPRRGGPPKPRTPIAGRSN